MSRTRKHPKRRKPFNPVKTFFKVMLSIVMVFVVLAGGACFAYHKVTGEWPFGGDTIAKDADETSMLDALLGRNMKLNVAVFGVMRTAPERMLPLSCIMTALRKA